jgi:hypothetical protein
MEQNILERGLDVAKDVLENQDEPVFIVGKDQYLIKIISANNNHKHGYTVRTFYHCRICGNLWQPQTKFYNGHYPKRCANFYCKSTKWRTGNE